MKTNNKLNIEGETYVIPGEGYNPSEITTAKKGDWNDFLIDGDSEEAEAEYIPPEVVSMETLKRIKALKYRVGIGALEAINRAA